MREGRWDQSAQGRPEEAEPRKGEGSGLVSRMCGPGALTGFEVV